MDKKFDEQTIGAFKAECASVLQACSIETLRVYGRYLQHPMPTKLKKEPLIQDIISILLGEEISGEKQAGERSARGAPPKNNHIDPEMQSKISELSLRYFGIANLEGSFVKEQKELLEIQQANPSNLLVFESNNRAELTEWKDEVQKEVYRGQVHVCAPNSYLLPLDFNNNAEKIVVYAELLNRYGLRAGDVITCNAVKHEKFLIASNVLTVNGMQVFELSRQEFDESEVCYPYRQIDFLHHSNAPISAKYVQWLLPFYHGQRGGIFAAPKAGKTTLIFELAKALQGTGVYPFVLLNAQAPETVWKFRNAFPCEQLVYTTYEDEADKIVLAADALLQRAKRYAECGKDVVLFVDSVNALAHAYNETPESAGGKTLAGGMESKTLNYIRKYLGAARCFNKSGSLTILAAQSYNTGNPADDLLASELRNHTNFSLSLSVELAGKRIYPAIDLLRSQVDYGAANDKSDFDFLDFEIRQNVLPTLGEKKFCEMLQNSQSKTEFLKKIGVKK